MKLSSMRIYLIIGCALAIACAVALYWGAHYFFSIKNVTVLYESPCSPALAQDIDAFLIARKNDSYLLLAQKIKGQFPAIEQINFQTVPANTCIAEITLSEPQVQLDNCALLCANGGLMNMHQGDTNLAEKIPLIHFEINQQAHNLTMQEKKWLCELSSTLCQSYTVTWHDAYHIELIDKKDPWFGITTTILIKPIDVLIKQCNIIKKNIENERLKKERRSNYYVADIRFENQIIVSAHKGGKMYGSII